MSARHRSRFWRITRLYFRRLRLAVWLSILLFLGVLLYLNQVGLPGFVKTPLLEKLREQGIDLRFSRLRLRLDEGIVAENVLFERADEPLSPNMSVTSVVIEFNPKALLKLRLQIGSLSLRGGRLVWPIQENRPAPRQLSLDNIRARLRFLPGDQWVLDDFSANFAGAKIQISGHVSNASEIRHWKFLQAEQPTPFSEWQNRLRELADVLQQIHFSVPPEFDLDLRGDAHDVETFHVRLNAKVPGADTPWGRLAQAKLGARLDPASAGRGPRAELRLSALEAQTPWGAVTNFVLGLHVSSIGGLTNLANADLNLRAATAHTRWGAATNLELAMRVVPVAGQTNVVQAQLSLAVRRAESPWGSAEKLAFDAQWLHALTNAIPLSGTGRLRCERAQGEWGRLEKPQLNTRLATAPLPAPIAPEALSGFPPVFLRLAPYVLDWDFQVAEFQSPQLEATAIAAAGNWRAPALALTNLQAQLYDGALAAHAALDVVSREVNAGLESNFDPRQLERLLTEPTRRFLEQFSWSKPPAVRAEAFLVMPAWTNRQPDWRGEVQPTLRVQGQFSVKDGGAYGAVPIQEASSHFSYSNLTWRLPDLTVIRPEGRLEAAHEANEATKDFYWHFHSTLDPNALRPLFHDNQARALDYFVFSRPPVIEAQLWGNSQNTERTRFIGSVTATNFSFRGQSVTGFHSGVEYTNGFVTLTTPQIERPAGERMSADFLVVDVKAQTMYLTNGFSTTAPMVVAAAIGPHIVRALAPFQFERPPEVHAHGIIPIRDEDDADLYFQVVGGPFHWTMFDVHHVGAEIHWLGQHLTLSNVLTDFYGGQATGNVRVDFHPGHDPDFLFSLTTRDTQLHGLMAAVYPHTNKLEGLLSGALVVTAANAGDWRRTQGYGNLDLRDGLIWDIPIFGVFSEVLNGLVPGLGHSRASAANCTFTITNGVIHSDDLIIKSSAMRLQYRGTVDLQGQITARVEAGLLRDMWLVGPIVSTVFWPVTKLFEYKVTGTLAHPKTEPVYTISKIVLFPLRPLHTLRDLLPEQPSHPSTPPYQPQ